MKKTINMLLASMIFIAACVPSAILQPTMPKAGHWEGKDPTVSFDIMEEDQITNFSMRVPYGGSTCNIYIASAAIQPDYSITFNLTSLETLSAGYIVGAFSGKKASGTYLIQMCNQGISFVPGEEEDRDWSAEWVANLESQNLPDPTQESIPVAKPTQQIAMLNIDAEQSTWFDTGIILRTSDELKIEVSGVIDLGGVESGPNGNPDIQPLGLGIVPDAPYGMLVGMIGSGSAFSIGSNYQGTVQSDGMLLLLINDVAEQYNDNTGQFLVVITITRSE